MKEKNYTLQTESAYTPSTTISLPHDCDFNEMRFLLKREGRFFYKKKRNEQNTFF